MEKNEISALTALDKLIAKARVHFYKPIQIAEILYRDRVFGDVNLLELETYRNASKRWRDAVCVQLIGRVSTSSARYQDDIFSETAIPPKMLYELGRINRKTKGGVECHIYEAFGQRFNSIRQILSYCNPVAVQDFDLSVLLSLFIEEPGLRRSIDKIYEIVVYALVASILEYSGVLVHIEIPLKAKNILSEFGELSRKIIGIDREVSERTNVALIHRLGVTNASDRGLDIWSNFGVAIQVKHLSLTLEEVQSIVEGIRAEHIVIVCKRIDKEIIYSVLKQMGLEKRLQSIVTEEELVAWYKQALTTKYKPLGHMILQKLYDEIILEFPATSEHILGQFMLDRGYQSAEPCGRAIATDKIN